MTIDPSQQAELDPVEDFRMPLLEHLKELRDRFKLDMSEQACKEHVQQIIAEACDNWRTRGYDKFQRYSVGIW